jgi:catechol 2,3-dioxygenase-like lactoylglutathione lyase family enzyme
MAQLKVSHVMLGVASREKSIPFYRDVLGLTLQFEHEGFAFFSGGGVTLAISEGLAQAYTNRVGATEVVFGVDDVRGTYEELRAKGVQFVNEPRQVTGPMYGANFKDPDGHGLSIFGPEGTKPA